MSMCLETIDKHTPEALDAEGFIDIDLDTLSSVLERDSLRVKESKLFAAIHKWSEAECSRQGIEATPTNRRSVLGDSLSKIRFPLMSVEEFAQGPAQSGILSDKYGKIISYNLNNLLSYFLGKMYHSSFTSL